MTKNYALGKITDGGESSLTMLDRMDISVIIEAVRYSAEAQRESGGTNPKRLNRIGRDLCATINSKWEDE